MIITRIECFPLRIPFKPGKSDASAWGDKDLPTADSLLVKVTTDQGLEGWGEAFGFRAVSSVKLAVNELIAPFCIGKDATQIAPLMLDVQKKLHVFGRGGALAFAISAVDIALGILRAKPPTHRCAGFWAVALRICLSTRAWSAIRSPRLSVPPSGGRSRRDLARSNFTKSSPRRSVPPARRPAPTSR
jgi:hypothetical protein